MIYNYTSMPDKDKQKNSSRCQLTNLEKFLIMLLVIMTITLALVIIFYQPKSAKQEVHVTGYETVVTESDVTTQKLLVIHGGRKPTNDDVVTEGATTTHENIDGPKPTTITRPKQKSDGLNTSVICNTRQCVDAAYLMINAIDESVDPCDNFYKYACGGWQKKSDYTSVGGSVDRKMKRTLKNLLDIEEEDVDVKKDISAFRKARMFYRSCMNTTVIEELGFTPAKKMLDSISQIYYRGDDYKMINLTHLFHQLLIRNGAPFFHISTHAHHSNNSQNVIHITPGKYLGILSKYHSRELIHQSRNLDSHELDNEKTYYNTTFLFNIILNVSNRKNFGVMLQLLQVYMDKNLTTLVDFYKQHFLEEELEAIYSDLQLIKPSNKQFQRDRELGKTHKKYSIGELQRQFGMVNWKVLLELLFRRPFSNNEMVLVMDPTYMTNLNKLFQKHGERIVNNAALILYANNMLTEITYGVSDMNRWELCVDATKLVLPEALSAMYIRTFSREKLNQIQSEVNTIFKDVKQSFKQVISNSKWLDNDSKNKMKLKMEKLTGTFGIHDILYNNTYINKAVENYPIDENNFFENVISGYMLNSLKNYDPNFNKATINDMTFKYLTMDNFFKDNAFYAPNFNALAITLGQLLPPYYDLHLPNYVTYGSVGFTIAHELAHGFDTSGILHDEYGNKKPWMPSRTSQHFQEKTECYRKMYETAIDITFRILEIPVSVKIDGKFTLDDNLADNSGMDIAYEAYKNKISKNSAEDMLPAMHLNPEQMFFLSVAQPFCANLVEMHYILMLETDHHSPNPERINVLMMNSERFSKAFQCSANSAMNLKSKCKLW